MLRRIQQVIERHKSSIATVRSEARRRLRFHKRYSDAAWGPALCLGALLPWAVGGCVSTSSPKLTTSVASNPPSSTTTTTTTNQSKAAATALPLAPVEDSFLLVSAAPDLRKLTVVVHVEPPPALAESYEKIAGQHPTLDALFRAHASESFGSGFLVVLAAHPGNKATPLRPLVVTNQHVVGLADSASIEVLGLETRKPATVVYVDPTYDLAVLQLDQADGHSLPGAGGFAIEPAPVKDQDAVVASGYPGLASKPSYQVTRGYVSNQRLLLPHDGGEQPYIQHTAPIDPGSSGGPLTNNNGKLVGMNTLKVGNREGVGLAVPASVIEKALLYVASKLEAPEVAPAARLRAACNELLGQLRGTQGTEAIERSISARMVAKYGQASLAALPADGTAWERLFLQDPAHVYLRAIALRLRGGLALDSSNNPQCDASAASTDPENERVVVRTEDHEHVVEFSLEQGQYKLTDAPLAPAKKRSFLERYKKPARRSPWKPSLR